MINCCDCVTLRADDLSALSWCSCGFSYVHQMLVQRVWFALESLPSANILSQTLTKTSNFSVRVSVSAPSQFFITLSICFFDVIITNDSKFVQLVNSSREKFIEHRDNLPPNLHAQSIAHETQCSEDCNEQSLQVLWMMLVCKLHQFSYQWKHGHESWAWVLHRQYERNSFLYDETSDARWSQWRCYRHLWRMVGWW